MLLIACSWAGGWTRWNILHEGIHTHVQSSIQHPERCLSCLQHHIPSHDRMPKKHIELLQVMRSRSLGCDGKQTFMDLHQKPEQKVEGNIMVPTQKKTEESFQFVISYLSSDSGCAVLQTITSFTNSNSCSHKWNTFRTQTCRHLGLILQFYPGGGEESGFCGESMQQDNVEPQLWVLCELGRRSQMIKRSACLIGMDFLLQVILYSLWTTGVLIWV